MIPPQRPSLPVALANVQPRPAMRYVELAARTKTFKPTTAPLILPPTRAERAFPWPLRLLGGVFLALAVVGTALIVIATFLLLGFALVAFTLAVSRWVPPPVTAVVVTTVLLLGGWAWVRS